MNKPLTLGSLFDGSGTFPMMAMLSGIVPVWKSEIEPFPIAVTEKRLPFVKHLGDINSVNGAEIEPVDIITFGSPCTDLSVAGKRQGLNAERSGLFFQAIRIIKEMRGATNGKYPRFAVWENVTDSNAFIILFQSIVVYDGTYQCNVFSAVLTVIRFKGRQVEPAAESRVYDYNVGCMEISIVL